MRQRFPHSRLLILGLLLCLFTTAIIPATLAQDDPVPVWDGARRFTILVLGMDRRPGARDTLNVRTDAIMLLSVNPAEQTIGLLHMPRDTHMPTPYSDQLIRINTLLVEGEKLQEDYGPYYAMDTYQYNLGMYIDGYIAFDFEAFTTIVDAVGGIEVYVPYAIVDDLFPDMNYGYDPVYLAPGTHRFNGYQALQYARTRHGDNDIMRGQRQMQVMLAIYRRVAQNNLIPSLLMQAPQLLDSLSHNIYTDLTLPDMLQLGSYAMTLPEENLRIGSMDIDYLTLYPLPSGRTIHIPNRDRLSELLTEVFGERYFE